MAVTHDSLSVQTESYTVKLSGLLDGTASTELNLTGIGMLE